MSKERELLKRLLENFERPVTGSRRFGDLFDEVRELLSAPEPTQDEEPIGQVGKCHTVTWFNKPEPLTYLYSHPAPRQEFVPLTEEELVACWGMPYLLSIEELRRFARAIEDALEEKNK